ncbi:MAG TPA: hypothetical protein PKB01_05905 [Xanthobacteraceae bacterium]|nr:hypothetical protein [Xanthobacteraceae bacterium]
MNAKINEKFRAIVEQVAREIVAAEHRVGGSFIRTPLMYPGGSTVVIRIEEGSDRFFVSDMGAGYEEAVMMGAGPMYAKPANLIAQAAGVRFDNQAFFVLEALRDQLAGAVVTIANCSQEAAVRASDALAEKTFEDKKIRLYNRLVQVFEPKIVTKNVEIIGASTQKWHVATVVSMPKHRPIIFEPVTKHPNSVANATMKFGDIALLPDAPRRVAVVQNRNDFGTLLTVLSRSADVIEDDAPATRIRRLAEAA